MCVYVCSFRNRGHVFTMCPRGRFLCWTIWWSLSWCPSCCWGTSSWWDDPRHWGLTGGQRSLLFSLCACVCLPQLQKQRQRVRLMETVLSSPVDVNAVDYVSSHLAFAVEINLVGAPPSVTTAGPLMWWPQIKGTAFSLIENLYLQYTDWPQGAEGHG